MAPKATRTVEDLLTDIHNTLVEGLEAILDEVKTIRESLVDGEVEVAGPENTQVGAGDPNTETGEPGADDPPPKKEEKPAKTEDVNHDDVSKEISEWIIAHPGCTAADVVKEHHISPNRAAAAVKKYGKKPEPKKITIEALRAKIDQFIAKFGMNEALKVNDVFGGAKKVSAIPEKKYVDVFEEMDRRLNEAATPGEMETKAETEAAEEGKALTIDDVRKAAQPFVDKYGDPAFRELLAKFVKKGVEAKISKLSPEQYPAVIEALANA